MLSVLNIMSLNIGEPAHRLYVAHVKRGLSCPDFLPNPAFFS